MEDHLNKFANWYSTAKKGEEYTYFNGRLAETRGPVLDDHGRLKSENATEFNMLCDQLWRMSIEGRVSLAQRRVGTPKKTADGKRIDPSYSGKFAYIAQKVK